MKTGEMLFYVQPGKTSYFVEMLIPQYNSGKVKQGQKVLLKFQACHSGNMDRLLERLAILKVCQRIVVV